MRTRHVLVTSLLLLGSAVLAPSCGRAQSSDPTFKLIYTFPGAPGAILAKFWSADNRGVIYGSGLAGGDKECAYCGTVFLMQPPAGSGGSWSQVTIYVFPGHGGGSEGGPVVPGPNHVVFGASLYGGPSGCGELYRFQQAGGAWKENVIHNFTCTDGSYVNGLVSAGGVLYGTTANGGAFGYGEIFQVNPPASGGGAYTLTVLYSFTGGADGANPTGLILWNGSLYGGTTGGGAGPCNTGQLSPGCGTIWQLAPPASGDAWTESTLYSFAGGADGSSPASLVADGDGGFYGVACGASCGSAAGQGAVFQLTPGPWTVSPLYTFGGQPDDGQGPNSIVPAGSGALVGTTGGGGSYNHGTAFLLSPPAVSGGAWTETIVHDFGSKSGSNPSGVVMGAKGVVYGATAQAGSSNAGTAFRIQP